MPHEKETIRKVIRAKRRAQPKKDELSQQIITRLMNLPEYAQAETVMLYVDVRDEVRTRAALPEILNTSKRLIVPYCVDDNLETFQLEDLGELAIGRYGILEPKVELRHLPSKRIDVEEIDLVVIPGLAFDKNGARLGHGKGYYDRLLSRASKHTKRIALAFECQIIDEVPTKKHDVYMHRIVTERIVYAGL